MISAITFSSCAQGTKGDIKLASKEKPAANEAVATFAEGCFWHAEIVFQSLVGVRDAVSGYAGGTDTKPDYQKVSSGSTGHAETVQVYYDPAKISIAFYRNEGEKQIIEAEIKRITAAKKYSAAIVTQVVPFTKFYPAEAYHQEYIYNNPGNGYVQNVSIPDFLKFKKMFKGNFK